MYYRSGDGPLPCSQQPVAGFDVGPKSVKIVLDSGSLSSPLLGSPVAAWCDFAKASRLSASTFAYRSVWRSFRWREIWA